MKKIIIVYDAGNGVTHKIFNSNNEAIKWIERNEINIIDIIDIYD